MLDALRRLEGKVYLTIDVDGLDPSIIPSTGTPQPGGLSWRQTMEILRVLTERVALPVDRGRRRRVCRLARSARLRSRRRPPGHQAVGLVVERAILNRRVQPDRVP